MADRTTNDGKDLEAFAAKIMTIMTAAQPGASVERNVQMRGADGLRQIDVLIRSRAGPFDLTTIIECKDLGRKVDVTRVDALHSVMTDVVASKGVIVSRKGFSKTAIQKARRVGISLLQADHLEPLRDLAQDVPIHVEELRVEGIRVALGAHMEGGQSFNTADILRVNDLDLVPLLRDDALRNVGLAAQVTAGSNVWTPSRLPRPWFIRDVDGRAVELDSLELHIQFAETHHFGYLGDLDEVLYVHDLTAGRQSVLLPASALLNGDYRRFPSYSRISDLPLEPKLSARVLFMPDSDPDPSTTEFTVRRVGDAKKPPPSPGGG